MRVRRTRSTRRSGREPPSGTPRGPRHVGDRGIGDVTPPCPEGPPVGLVPGPANRSAPVVPERPAGRRRRRPRRRRLKSARWRRHRRSTGSRADGGLPLERSVRLKATRRFPLVFVTISGRPSAVDVGPRPDGRRDEVKFGLVLGPTLHNSAPVRPSIARRWAVAESASRLNVDERKTMSGMPVAVEVDDRRRAQNLGGRAEVRRGRPRALDLGLNCPTGRLEGAEAARAGDVVAFIRLRDGVRAVHEDGHGCTREVRRARHRREDGDRGARGETVLGRASEHDVGPRVECAVSIAVNEEVVVNGPAGASPWFRIWAFRAPVIASDCVSVCRAERSTAATVRSGNPLVAVRATPVS